MINETDFLRIKKEMDSFDEEREALIKISRDILKLSKHAIFSIHKNNIKEAEAKIQEAEAKIKDSKKHLKCSTKLDHLGAMSAALQEYVEAKCYYSYVQKKKIPSQKSLKVEIEDYLLGLCDLTGELGRRAVMCVIDGKEDEVVEIRNIVEKIFSLFLELNLRNGELRKKSDAIKWNLKKIESIIYDLKTRGRTE